MDLQQIGKYKILSKIGEGAMGVVYKAHDAVLNRFVAVKTIASQLDSDEDLRNRFKREAQSAGALNHPNIVTVHDFGEENGRIYMAMELLEGTDLRHLIRSRTSITLEQKLRIMEQMCDGLAFAHSKEVVHRDLKPSNIHLQPNGQVKIMDFGLARLSSSDITRSGLVMGTPNYMSPEQFQGQKVDHRSDVFSLGAVFYELLSYRKPYDADSLHTIMFKVLQDERAPLAEVAPDLPGALVELVERSLAKDPSQRFQNVGDIRAMLGAIRRSLPAGGEETVFALDIAPLLDQTLLDAPGSGSSRPGSRPPSSITGRASIQPRTASLPGSPVEGQRGSRAPLYAVAAIALIGVVGGLVYVATRPTPAPRVDPSADGMKQQIGVLTNALVASQLEQAEDKLEGKDYASAVQRAESVLQLDPGNAKAREIKEKARATLEELDRVAREAKEAIQAGRTEDAASALARVLAIDPAHPVAEELSGELNSRFKSQAEDARRRMTESRKQADAVKGEVREEFEGAGEVALTGEAFFQKAQYAQAAQKYLDARDRFDRATRLAKERQATALKEAKSELQAVAGRWSSLRDEAQKTAAGRAPSFQKALTSESRARELSERGDVAASLRAYQEAMAFLAEAQAESMKEQATSSAPAPAEVRPAPDSPEPTGRGGSREPSATGVGPRRLKEDDAPRHEPESRPAPVADTAPALPAAVTPQPAAPTAPVRVETGSREAIPIVKVNPVYPPVAVRSKSEGRVLLAVEVDREGKPVAVQAVKPTPLFEKAAIDAVKQWRWRPFLLNGQAVPFHLTVNIDFKLAAARN